MRTFVTIKDFDKEATIKLSKANEIAENGTVPNKGDIISVDGEVYMCGHSLVTFKDHKKNIEMGNQDVVLVLDVYKNIETQTKQPLINWHSLKEVFYTNEDTKKLKSGDIICSVFEVNVKPITIEEIEYNNIKANYDSPRSFATINGKRKLWLREIVILKMN